MNRWKTVSINEVNIGAGISITITEENQLALSNNKPF